MYSSARGYDAQMATIGLGVYLYKVIDGVADVYEAACSRPTNSTWLE